MMRDRNSRRQQSGAAPVASPQRRPRSVGSRVGLRKKQPQPAQNQNRNARPQNPQPPRPTQNPQQNGYRPGAPRQRRRVTQAQQLRMRRRRAVVGLLCVLAALIFGVVLSINLLFKITDIRLENTDRTTPANTGIYTEQQIIELLGVQAGDNLFGFSTKQKGQQMLAQLPYLDELTVKIQMPSTVVVRVRPATERFALQNGSEWLILSTDLKVLRSDSAQPDGLILLEAAPELGQATTPGSCLTLATNNSLDGAEVTGTASQQSTDETALSSANAALTEMVSALEDHGLLDGISVISLQDMSELNVLYQGRVSIKLGTANNLDYKIRLAAQIISDPEKGLGSSDRGTLDVSYQRSDGEIWGYFQPAEAPAEEQPQEQPAE